VKAGIASRLVTAGVFLLGIPLGAGPASAGWVIDEVMKGVGGEGAQPARQQTMLQSNRMKRLTLGADGNPTHAFILNLDTETITNVDYAAKRYITTTVQEFVQTTTAAMKTAQGAQAQMAQAMPQMQEAMKNLPPEQRKMMEEMMRSRMPQSGTAAEECREPKVEVHRTGKQEVIAGYRAAQYEILADSKPESEVWIAKDLTAAWRELDPNKLQRIAAEMAKVARCAPGGAQAGPRADEAMKLAAEGYPVRTVARGGRPVTVEVVKATARSVSAGEFEPPAGFTSKSLQEMMTK
jgi:hypothetical protein